MTRIRASGTLNPASCWSWTLGPVVVDPQLLDECGRGPARPHGREVGLGVGDGLRHLVRGFEENVLDHDTSVPIDSPSRARLMFPASIRLKTTIGSMLSMQNVMAVESITLSPRLSTSM